MWYQFQWVFLWRPEICYLTTSTEMQLRLSFDWFGRSRNILFSAQRRRWCVNDLSTSCKTFNKHANLCSISCSFLALFCMRQTFNTANSRQGVTRPIWRELCLHHKKCFFFFFFYIFSAKAPCIRFRCFFMSRTVFNFSRVVKIFWVTLRHAAFRRPDWLSWESKSPQHQTRIKSW